MYTVLTKVLGNCFMCVDDRQLSKYFLSGISQRKLAKKYITKYVGKFALHFSKHAHIWHGMVMYITFYRIQKKRKYFFFSRK